MVNTIVFENEITLWWDIEEYPNAEKYQFSLDGKYHGETQKTHYTFFGLQEERAYRVRVEIYDGLGNKQTEEWQIQTQKKKNRLDVTKAPYNAVGDGKTLNTAALQKAFDDCTANDFVYIPKGKFMTGALNMHGENELYLEQGAILQGTANPDDYLPKIKSRFEGTEGKCYRSLINIGELDYTAGYTTRNVFIRGKGVIFGGGEPLARAIIDAEKLRLAEYLANNQDYVKTCESADTIPGRARGRLINISNCENVTISGLTLGYGASWNVHFVYSKNVVTHDCQILSDNWESADGVWKMEEVHNGDGWDPDSSEDCVIFNTVFNTRDDAIAIKSGKNPEGNLINRPTKNICIFDCSSQLRGIAIGSELSGGISDIKIWDCDFFNGKTGFNIKTTRKRGGYVKNVTTKRCAFASVWITSEYNCNDDGDGNSNLTVVEDISFEDVKIKGTYPYLDKREQFFYTLYLSGFDGEEYHFKNLRFKNLQVYARDDGNMQCLKIKNVKNLTLENVNYFE